MPESDPSDGLLFDWISFKPLPKKEGLHDSGYRFIEVTGWVRGSASDKPVPTVLGRFCDHITVGGRPSGFGPSPVGVGIDVEADGTQRVFLRDGDFKFRADRTPFYSDACFEVVHVRK